MPTEKQLANLEKGKATQFISGEKAAENGKKGGIASGKSRAALKSFRQIDAETTTSEERREMLDKLKQMALRGNIKALELYLKIIGEYETKIMASIREPLRNLSLAEIKELIDDA